MNWKPSQFNSIVAVVNSCELRQGGCLSRRRWPKQMILVYQLIFLTDSHHSMILLLRNQVLLHGSSVMRNEKQVTSAVLDKCIAGASSRQGVVEQMALSYQERQYFSY